MKTVQQMAKEKQKALQRKKKLLGFKEWLAKSYRKAIKPTGLIKLGG